MASRLLILSGFKEDCEQLIARFEQANDIRFETFCDIWKAMKFSLIFTGRPSFSELLEFCEEALNVCKQFLLLPPRFKERIGGLYLLYGIYYKIPIEQLKIRVKSDDWRSIMDLHAEIKEAEHLDANYILCKLIVDNAFYFCMFDVEFGLEKHYRIKNTKCFNPYSVLPTLKDLTDKNQMMSSIDDLSKAYEDMKRTLKLKNESDTSLKLFNSNIAEEIINDIREFEERRRNMQIKAMLESERASVASTSKGQKNSKLKRKGRARPMFDDVYLMESCESEDDVIELDDCDSDLSENFD
ncbi:proximal sequence element A Pbp45 [Xylocopa sonorina]|uniref:proximal sequence element A Pbp45 n=1 Tax=Xylocopa sonorina TaxID=1818115 RepID=UPI00403B12CA